MFYFGKFLVFFLYQLLNFLFPPSKYNFFVFMNGKLRILSKSSDLNDLSAYYWNQFPTQNILFSPTFQSFSFCGLFFIFLFVVLISIPKQILNKDNSFIFVHISLHLYTKFSMDYTVVHYLFLSKFYARNCSCIRIIELSQSLNCT